MVGLRARGAGPYNRACTGARSPRSRGSVPSSCCNAEASVHPRPRRRRQPPPALLAPRTCPGTGPDAPDGRAARAVRLERRSGARVPRRSPSSSISTSGTAGAAGARRREPPRTRGLRAAELRSIRVVVTPSSVVQARIVGLPSAEKLRACPFVPDLVAMASARGWLIEDERPGALRVRGRSPRPCGSPRATSSCWGTIALARATAGRSDPSMCERSTASRASSPGARSASASTGSGPRRRWTLLRPLLAVHDGGLNRARAGRPGARAAVRGTRGPRARRSTARRPRPTAARRRGRCRRR